MTINCNGTLINFNSPKVMGILNITPDSFYDGGKLKSDNDVLLQVEKMLSEGADFIDIGGYSSRPNAKDISVIEEKNRVLPVVKSVLKEFPGTLISIDTFRSEVANAILNEGAALVNDISAGDLDKNMMTTIAEFKVPYIMMHMKGNPQNMMSLADYQNVITEVCFYFSKKITEALALGINDVIVDAGFGFAKTIAHNYQLLNKLQILTQLEAPLLTGISRKSMIYKTLKNDANNALNGTTALHMVALQKGSNILRVHDIKEAKECILLFETLKEHENF